MMTVMMPADTDGALTRFQHVLEAFYMFGYYDNLHFTNEETKAWRD